MNELMTLLNDLATGSTGCSQERKGIQMTRTCWRMYLKKNSTIPDTNQPNTSNKRPTHPHYHAMPGPTWICSSVCHGQKISHIPNSFPFRRIKHLIRKVKEIIRSFRSSSATPSPCHVFFVFLKQPEIRLAVSSMVAFKVPAQPIPRPELSPRAPRFSGRRCAGHSASARGASAPVPARSERGVRGRGCSGPGGHPPPESPPGDRSGNGW